MNLKPLPSSTLERDAFEVWHKSQWTNISLARDDYSGYYVTEINGRWWAWQAAASRAALARVSKP